MIIEYINEEGNISCQIDEINENNIMHVVFSLSGNDMKPQISKYWNIYVNKNETEEIIKTWLFKLDSHLTKLGKFIHPAIGTVNFITIPTFENINKMNEHYKKEHLKWVESVKILDPTAEYDEETGAFKL